MLLVFFCHNGKQECICTIRDRQTSGPIRTLSVNCVDIASGSVLPVAQWTWYVHAVSGSIQTGRSSGKCLFV